MNTPAFVYGLVNTKTLELVYVGRTVNPHARFAAHKKTTLKGLDCFEMQILEETTRGEVNDHELFWITYMNFLGAHLINKKYVREVIRTPERKVSARSSCRLLNLAMYMSDAGMDVSALAIKAGLSEVPIQNAIKGRCIGFKSIKKIAGALKVSPEKLL